MTISATCIKPPFRQGHPRKGVGTPTHTWFVSSRSVRSLIPSASPPLQLVVPKRLVGHASRIRREQYGSLLVLPQVLPQVQVLVQVLLLPLPQVVPQKSNRE